PADQLDGTADSAQNAAAQDKLATSTKKAGKAAKDNIQSFDKLNVRQKDTSTASADTSTGAVSGTSAAPKATSGIAMKADIQDGVSPKVRRMADNIKDAIKKIADIINQFMPLIQGVGTAFGIVFAVGRIKKFIKVFEKIPGLIPLLTSLKMAIQRIGITALRGHSQVLRLTDGVNDTQKSLKGFMANLSPMQKAVVTIAGLAAVFTTAKSAFKDVAKGTRSVWSALCQLLPVVIAVGAAMMAMFPQHAVLAGVVAGITAVVGVIAGFAEAEKEAEQARIDEYFSGVAVSTEDLAESLAPMTERYDSLNQKMEEHRQKSQEISDEYNKASDSLDIMFTQLSAGETTVPNSAQVIYDGLIAVGESVKKSADEDASYYMSHWKEVFDNVGTLTSAEQGEILNNIQQLSIDKKKKVDEIEQEITKIHDGAKSRNVGKTVEYTKEELIKLQGFQDDLDALMSLERNKELEKSKIQSAQLYDDIKSGRKKVNKDTYQELLDEVAKGEQDAVDKAKEIQAEGLANAESNLTAARQVYGENSDEYEKAYADYTTMVDQTNREFTKAMEEAALTANTTRTMLKEKLSEDLKPLDETQKKIDELAGVTNELANSSRNVQDFVNKGRLGAEEYKKLNDKVKELKEKQQKLTKELENNDNASKDFFGTWKLKTPGLKNELKGIIGAVDTSIDKSVKTFASYGTSSADELKKGISSRYSEVKATSEKMGKNLTDGLSKGIKDNKKDSTKAVGDTADDMEKEFRKKTDTHSPSRKYKSLGEFLIQGLINGINGTKKAAIRAFTELFNAILDKAQKFSDRFRQGMSGTISGFAASMNSATVNPKDGRIVYTKMPEVRIPKLATGAVIPP
ncbi:MAG: hypothetical protein ACI4IV_02890, partial [Acutalibacteraceae bacterium]